MARITTRTGIAGRGIRSVVIVLCAATLSSSVGSANRPEVDLDFTVVAEPGTGAIATPTDLVIRDEAAWQQFWAALHPGTPAPAIRFPDRMVVISALGQQPIGGPVGIEVTRVTRRASPGLTPALVTIYITEHRPGRGCGGPSVLTFPYTIIETAASNEVTFRRRTRYARCG
jgi:hypothetical protein